MPHGLDTETEVFFYEQEFYPLSNFSSFELLWKGHRFATSEHAYHYEKFTENAVNDGGINIRYLIMTAASAHEVYKLAQENKKHVRKSWDRVKVSVMWEILRAKVAQHDYVRKKLLETGDRTIIENSWRDKFWGWGPDKKGKNMLGKLWMEVRNEVRQAEG